MEITLKDFKEMTGVVRCLDSLADFSRDHIIVVSLRDAPSSMEIGCQYFRWEFGTVGEDGKIQRKVLGEMRMLVIPHRENILITDNPEYFRMWEAQQFMPKHMRGTRSDPAVSAAEQIIRDAREQ